MKQKLTICHISCGELTEKECKDSLKQFEGEACFQNVKNVRPQIKALNQMIDQCETEFLIPLDNDMVLHEGAIERVKNGIKIMQDNENCHSVLYSLWDTLTEQKIYALKLLRTNIIKEHMFLETCTPDIEHYARLKDNGYYAIDLFKEYPIGKHVVKGDYICYHKYRDVYMTMRSHKRLWCDGVAEGKSIRECSYNHYQFFKSKYNSTKNKDYLYCVAGMLDGLTSKLEHKSKSLDKPMKISIEFIGKKFSEWYLKNEMNERFEI